MDYRVDEVLAHQTPEVRELLLQSAVLDRLTGPLCDAVTGGDNGHAVLMALERANPFLLPLDDHREWYRCQHLFADVLRGRLLQAPSEEMAVLHLLQPLARDERRRGGICQARTRVGDFGSAAYLMEAAMRCHACAASVVTRCS